MLLNFCVNLTCKPVATIVSRQCKVLLSGWEWWHTLLIQHSRGRGRWNSVRSWPSWSIHIVSAGPARTPWWNLSHKIKVPTLVPMENLGSNWKFFLPSLFFFHSNIMLIFIHLAVTQHKISYKSADKNHMTKYFKKLLEKHKISIFLLYFSLIVLDKHGAAHW